eukprot:CAMPEP_0168562252 /NCGR_PEP_ID=MMETSP0413-20121227/12024_1 /TAXON_ID=136452 /ORGANISM="Filamoeba nolandi, Strain NC-AS-23-1" /LENGTH=64 /DNA_ID=CAMNT_0008593667 /DNA_START=76 /DNA_END=270 /DNA_ORIENTATION=-
MMRGFLPFGPQMMMGGEDDFMDIEIDPEDAMAIMEAMGEHMQEKLLDADFFNAFDDDFDDDDLS